MRESFNCAILFVNKGNDATLARVGLLGKHLIDYTVSQIRRLDVETIYLVGSLSFDLDGVIKRDNVEEIISEIKSNEGKCLLVSCLYPLIEKEDYELLLGLDHSAVFVSKNNDIIPAFSIDNKLLESYEILDYEGIKLDENKAKKFTGEKDIPSFESFLKDRVNKKLISKGVLITDNNNVVISEDAIIDKDTIIYPNVVIEGKCLIGKNNVIKSNTYLKNVVLGDNNIINSSSISDSVIHNNVSIGNRCDIDSNTEIFDGVKVGSLVKLSDTKIGKDSEVEHLCFLGNGIIGDNVKIGSGVITVNSDERSKNSSIIKSHSVIGSNVSLLAPITIGEYVVVAAGSTIDTDVRDGDMAIARLYQQNKKGYGYKYIKED